MPLKWFSNEKIFHFDYERRIEEVQNINFHIINFFISLFFRIFVYSFNYVSSINKSVNYEI